MLWFKAFHLIFMVTWFAALFYLPRLFVYHACCDDEPGRARFKIMERKLLWGIATPGGILTLLFGFATLAYRPDLLAVSWMQAKLLLVGMLIAYHVVSRPLKSLRFLGAALPPSGEAAVG